MPRAKTHQRNRERGVTMLLVVAAMFAILAMAALSIDVMTLYAAHTDAQRASDAAALAGARMFVLSGFTSGQLGDPTLGATQSLVCTGGSPGAGVANSEAVTVAAQNQIAGQTATVTSITCDFTTPQNPRLTVTTGRTDLPTFFGRIFGHRMVSVSGSSTAEAFNASGSSTPVSLGSVKPWAIPNCDPHSAFTPPAGGPCGPYFVDSANNYVLKNPAAYIGQQFSFQMRNQANPPGPTQYYVTDLPTTGNLCPAASAVGCLNIGGGVGSVGYLDNIACARPSRLQCGDTIDLDKLNGSPPNVSDTISGTQCLTHTTTTGSPIATSGQDLFTLPGGPGNPVVITGGLDNPNPALQGVTNVSRSDSVVTVPLFDWNSDPCPTQKCGTETVMGFLQLGIQDVTTAGNIDAVILNATGCNPLNAGTTPVTGGGISAVPVRLVQ